jgi:hypothetical protein
VNAILHEMLICGGYCPLVVDAATGGRGTRIKALTPLPMPWFQF